MTEKVTLMVLNTVDLECSSCYKKVKKVLCKFPQITDQIYDEKNSKVSIKVVCCSPEKIRDKLCCKGGKVIKSIEILEDPKPKAPEKPKEPEKPKAPEKPKEPEKPKAQPKAPEKPKEPEKPKAPEKPKEPEKPKLPADKPAEKPKPKDPAPAPVPVPVLVPVPAPAPKAPEPVAVNICVPVQGYPGYPPIPMYPSGACCGPCYDGFGGGPCFHGYRRPVPPPPAPCYEGYGYGYGYRGSKCCVNTDYFSEENPQGCTIM